MTLGLDVDRKSLLWISGFETPYGSLPEIVVEGMGVLSISACDLTEAIKNLSAFDRKTCHEYVCRLFRLGFNGRGYLGMYERVLNGEQLNDISL